MVFSLSHLLLCTTFDIDNNFKFFNTLPLSSIVFRLSEEAESLKLKTSTRRLTRVLERGPIQQQEHCTDPSNTMVIEILEM